MPATDTRPIYPPTVPFPNLPREDLSILTYHAKTLVYNYNLELERYEPSERNERNLQESLMLGHLRKLMPNHRYVMEPGTSGGEIVTWLLACRDYWRRPHHVQVLEEKLAILEQDLQRHKDYIAWQKQHLSSPKFWNDTTIQVGDLLNAMTQAGV